MAENASLSYLYALAEGDMGFVNEILDLMSKNIPIDIKAIENALAANDLKQVKRDAHKMKSSIQYGDCIELSDLLADIENKKESDAAIAQIKEMIPELKELSDKLMETINAEKKKIG
jgi:HPt (histidine-containing phosphotransfer) domain-containing protein